MAIYAGLDLSLTHTAIAVIRSGDPDTRTIRLSSVQTSGKKGDTWETRHNRLCTILGRTIHTMLSETRTLSPDPRAEPAVVGIEGPAYSSNLGSVHDRSGLWWLIYNNLTYYPDIEILPITPNVRAKYATGKGNAGKDAVLTAVVRRYDRLMATGHSVTDNNAADAVAIAAQAARYAGEPIEDPLPQTHLAAMKSLPARPLIHVLR